MPGIMARVVEFPKGKKRTLGSYRTFLSSIVRKPELFRYKFSFDGKPAMCALQIAAFTLASHPHTGAGPDYLPLAGERRVE